MRIYHNVFEAFRETERELWEMGIDVHPQTMQDKFVGDNPDYITKELSPYTFQISKPYTPETFRHAVQYLFTNPQDQSPNIEETNAVMNYIKAEHRDRTSGEQLNPGNSYLCRPNLWKEFLHDGKFSYTYSERLNGFGGQLNRIINELQVHPETRQAKVDIHNNWQDISRIGGVKRIPCSLYYQFLRRRGALDIIYAMRSCDFLTHFPVDVILAIKMQQYVAQTIGTSVGRFTYFTASLHAYHKDMKIRGIF